ncbi:MAG: DUF1573 domain-containing protein [Planctomycetota bacterium]|nr:MAG: DUF1573 domain-containing protein [Planctomycetota bacterium]REJ97714.1 MAG: DUF1573 domain-containing protein [Planctomycetota bacterium]REK26672.1 MAG: DUF1573 domain-containing protein [Planctomycetota bacterium]REK35669.1 MAG: DUF1573 domain-containing protein [Planctomycetota bacterium]
MRKTIGIRQLMAWAVLAVLASAASAQDRVADDGDDWARKMFSELEHDFGNVARGADVRHKIAVKNLYEETIHITNVKTTCGCAAAEPDRKVLATGETAYIEVVMNTVKFQKEKNSNVDVTLTFNNRDFKTVRIPIRAYIRPDVVLDPGRADFGSVEVGRGGEKRIRVAYAGRDGWAVTGVESQSDLVLAEIEETSRSSGRVSYQLTLNLSPEAPQGAIRSQVILSTNDERSPEVAVLVQGEVVPDIIVNPTTLDIGDLAPGSSRTMSVVVRGRRPFSIDKIECESEQDCFKVRLGKDVRNVHVVPLTVTAPMEPGDLKEKFYLTISGREEPVEFYAKGTVVSQGT